MRNDWRSGLLALLLLAATIFAYQPAWHAGFIWDDDVYVTENRLLTAPDGLKRIWFSADSPSQYFPLVYTVLRAERGLWGLHAAGYHWVNILLHAANALLLWRVLRRLRVPAAWFGAALFALHPVQVESVAWVTELKNVLSLFFFLLAAWEWLYFVEDLPGSWWCYGTALLCQALALASKTTACTLPAALALILWLQGKPLGFRRLCHLLSFLALGLIMGLLSVWWERHHQYTVGAAFSLGPVSRLLIASRAVWFYAGKLLWPSHLSFSYGRWSIDPADPLDYCWLAAGLMLAVSIWALRRFVGRGLETAALFYVAMLSPLLGFIMEYTFRYSFVADHYQYAAAIGPLALAAAALDKLLRRVAPATPVLRPLAGALLLALLGTLTWNQCRIYADSESLWRATLERTPESCMARNNLSAVLIDKGELQPAIRLSRQVLALQPNDPVAENNLGLALLDEGKVDEAIAHCQASLAAQPNGPMAYYNLGQAYLKKGRFDAAITNFQMTARLKPDYAKAWCNLGYALLQSGQLPAAIVNYNTSLELAPDYPLPHNDLGSIYLRLGDTNQALAHFQRAVALDPTFVEARYNLGGIFLAQGRLDDALSQYDKVAELSPRLAAAHYMLGKLAAAYAAVGRTGQAAATAEHALQLARSAGETSLAAALSAQLESYRPATPKN